MRQVEAALEEVAEVIIEVVQKVCLPKPVAEAYADRLVVTHTCPQGRCSNGATSECVSNAECEAREGQVVAPEKPLVLGDRDTPGSFQLLTEVEDCRVGDASLPAVQFIDPPKPGELIRVEYAGDAQLELQR